MPGMTPLPQSARWSASRQAAAPRAALSAEAGREMTFPAAAGSALTGRALTCFGLTGDPVRRLRPRLDGAFGRAGQAVSAHQVTGAKMPRCPGW